MAAGDPIPPDRTIYRAIRKKDLSLDNALNETAFLLKPAHDEWPDETYLSFGVDAAGAVAGLDRIRYVAQIVVADIIASGLTVTEDADPRKVQVAGMPLVRDDEGTAFKVAKDLKANARLLPYP